MPIIANNNNPDSNPNLTPYPFNQTLFGVGEDGGSYNPVSTPSPGGCIYLSTTPITSAQIPSFGGTAKPDKIDGDKFAQRFQNFCADVEALLCEQNGYLLALNNNWAACQGANPQAFLDANKSTFKKYYKSAQALLKLLGLPETFAWPATGPSTASGSGNPMLVKPTPVGTGQFSVTGATPGKYNGEAEVFLDQETFPENAASWGFITNYTMVLFETTVETDPSSSSSYYSTYSAKSTTVDED
jgi:hypothetical protein